MEQAVYLSGIAVMAYHSMYEAYVRELLTPTTQDKTISIATGWEPGPRTATLDGQDRPVSIEQNDLSFARTPLSFDLSSFLQNIAERSRKVSYYVGYDSLRVFSNQYVDLDSLRDMLRENFTVSNPGYRLAHGTLPVTKSNMSSYLRLRGFSQDLMELGGKVTRQTVTEALKIPVFKQKRALTALQGLCTP